MDDNSKINLAQGSFIEKWPSWLRWLLFIPAAILVPMLFFLFQSFIQTWFLDIGPNAFYLVLMRGVIYGAGIPYVEAFVAPNYQKIVSLILTIIVAMLVGVGIYAAYIIKAPITNFIEDLIMIFSAGATTFYIFNEFK